VVIQDRSERHQLELQLRQAQRLESVGRLAAGIAHEINTPTQFVRDNMTFLGCAFDTLLRLVDGYRTAVDDAGSAELRTECARADEDADIAFLRTEVPSALASAVEGADRISTIVRAVGDFSGADAREQLAIDLHVAIRSTLLVARQEYRHVADVEFEPGVLPDVVCFPGDLNQVFLNVIENAAHAIADANGQSGARGVIRIRTWREGRWAVVAISDTGTGIPPSVHDRLFEPFFTTKPVGRGTGLGLPLARAIVVDKHGGQLTFDTETGRGTTFYVRVPIAGLGADTPHAAA
jgi:signal transduction histidine kinase